MSKLGESFSSITGSVLQRVQQHLKLGPIAILIIVSTLTLACHLSTVKHYPISWMDEVWIREYGRYSIYDQHPEWAVDMRATQPATIPPPFISYIGGFVMETLYRSTGSYIVPRCFALSGLLFAVALFYVWLRKKGFSPQLTLIAALLLLSDTNATWGVHWYRLDMWVMGLTFLCASLVLCCAGKPEPAQRKVLFSVGCIMAFQFFFWPSAVIQWLLIIAEVLTLAVAEKWELSRYIRSACSGLLGMLIVSICMVIPIFADLQSSIFKDRPSMMTSDCLLRFIKLIARTPFIWMGAAVGFFFWRKHPFHLVALLLGTIVVLSTIVYHARVNYLTPLAFLFFTEGMKQCLIRAKSKITRILTMAFLAAALSFSFLLSVIVLNYVARPLTQENTYDALLGKMEATIGRGPKHIYTFTYDIYHVGRKLGWQMFSFLPGKPESLFVIEVSKFLLDDLEYIIISDDYAALNADQKKFLSKHGFEPWKRVELPADVPVGLTSRFRPIIYAGGYSSFAVWKKRDTAPAHTLTF